MAAVKGVIFDDVFEVTDKDAEESGKQEKQKKFVRVSRFNCVAVNFPNFELVVDINTQLYPMNVGDRFSFCLASTLNQDGQPGTDEYNPKMQSSRADSFDYVMYGTVYRLDESGEQLSVYISFGGLLMRLKGDTSQLMKPELKMDSKQYLLIRKT
eukprot:m.353648 g.353648  ORF g.353648 m.353648 type:complete len:155 (-) comp16812_c0_seq1:211-675(-)